MPKESLPAFACEYYLVVRHVFCCFAALCSRVHQWRAAAFCAKERAVRSWCCGEVLSLNAVWEWNGKAKGLPACLPACEGACVCVCVCVCVREYGVQCVVLHVVTHPQYRNECMCCTRHADCFHFNVGM